MAEKEIINTIKRYVQELQIRGVQVRQAILFGSFAQENERDEWSDIDILIISPQFDISYTRDEINILWRVAADVDSRIEPIAVGEAQWKNDDQNHIIEVARREGIAISA